MIDQCSNGGIDEEIQDAECVRRIRASGIDVSERDEMYRILTEKYHGTVFAICMRRMRNAQDAEEVTQEVFLRFFRKIDQLKDPDSFPGWLKRIAVRLSINHAVRKDDTSLVSHEVLDEAYGETEENPVVLRGQKDVIKAVRKIIPEMGVMDREVLVGFYYGGESLKDLSDRLSIPVGTIKRRLFTARSRLRDRLLDVVPDLFTLIREID